MPRKQRTEEEKAQTELSQRLAAHPQTPKSLETVIEAIMLYHNMDRREAVCALRDYFQVEVAKQMDLMAKGLDDDFQKLKHQLESELKSR